MDGWSRIPKQHGASHSARPSGNSLPAPGSVVMASVEEDLGEGMYALRWAGQRIAVSSRVGLKPGQSLILKSELSAEGKPTLVVQGPALPNPGDIVGRVVYGPAKKTDRHGATNQQNQTNQQNRQVDDQAGQGASGQARAAASPPPGGHVAAGVIKINASTTAAPQSAQSLIGLVLEPLPEFKASVEFLMTAVKEEKARLDDLREHKRQHGEKSPAEAGSEKDAAAGERADASEKSRNARVLLNRPASEAEAGAQAARREMAAAAPDAAGKAAPPRADVLVDTVAALGRERPRPESTPAPAPAPAEKPAETQKETSSSASANPVSSTPVSDGTASRQDGARTENAAQSAPGAAAPAAPSPAPATAHGDARAFAIPLTDYVGPVVPEVPASQPRPAQPSPDASGTQPAQTSTAIDPALAAGTQAGAAAVSPSLRPSGQVVPEVVLPESRPTPQAIPDASVAPPSPSRETQPPPASGEVVPAPAPADSSAPATRPAVPVSPDAAASAARPADSTVPAGEAAPAPGSGAAVPADSAASSQASRPVGPLVPDVPAPDSRPASPPASDGAGAARQPSRPQDVPQPAIPPESAPQAAVPQPSASASQAAPPGSAAAPETHPASPAATREMKPEVFLKEALTQIVKAAELPLASPSADGESLGVGGKVPDAIVDKAAGLLVQAAGLTPDTATMEAARALVQNNVQVDRETVQAMIALAAGALPEDRESLYRAAARLSAKEIPLAAPLVSGLADVMDRRAGVHELMEKARQALEFPPDLPEAEPLVAGAKELLDLLHVDLDSADAAQALERYVSTFGREALGQSLALVEKSAQAVLENHPVLPKIDQALTAVLTELESALAALSEPAASAPPAALPGTVPPGASLPGQAGESAPAGSENAPPPTASMAHINAYIKAPRAAPVEELLKNLPPMPKLARLDQPVPQQFPTTPQPTAVPRGMPAAAMGQAAGATPELIAPAPVSGRPQTEGGQPTAPPQATAEGTPASSILNKLDSLFQIPGLNKPELELLQPSGFLERFLNSGQGGRDPAQVKAEADVLFRQLLSENPEQAAKAMGDLKQKDQAVLRETAARLTRTEADVVRNEPALGRLSEAASSLRDLGRQLLAVKAENLAGQERQPGVMLAEVPFKLNDDAGDGRMQMFYRRGKGKQEGWTSRVILDLNTTRMGPVLGDMRFFGQDMVINMFVEKQDTADYLERSAEDLIDGLWAKGFRVKTRFMVLPSPPPPPELRADRPQIAGEPEPQPERPAGSSGGTTRIGRLDVKG